MCQLCQEERKGQIMAEIIDETCHGCPGALACTTEMVMEILYCAECERIWLRLETDDAGESGISAETSIYVENTCPKIPPESDDLEGSDRDEMSVLCPECFQSNAEDLGTVSDTDEYGDGWWGEEEDDDIEF